MKKILRPYQQQALDSIIKEFETKNKQLCVLPTGSGKTVLFSHLIEKLKLKTLIIAHTTELIDQIHSTIQKECFLMKSEIYNWPCKLKKDVIVCSFQSAIRESTLQRLSTNDFDLLIIDECHRSASNGYRQIIDRLGFAHKKLLGFTATPFRTDGQSIYSIFGFPSFTKSIIEMIHEGYLVDYLGYKVSTNVSIHGISKQKGDFVSTKLESVINVKNRNQLIVKEYFKIAPNEKALAFCTSVKHAYDLKKEFLENGISCEAIEGKMDKELRKEVLSKFKEGRIKVITNFNVLTEGFDEPSITCLLMGRPTISKCLYMQMIGRGSRTFEGKEHCKVIDFTDNDFDVCSLEDVLDSKQKKCKINNGERLSSFFTRTQKELLYCGEDTFIEKKCPIRKDFYQNLATEWQKNQLKQKNIKFFEPLLEVTANYLLNKV